MSKEFHIECCICALERAKDEAKMAGINWYFCSEIDHLIDTARANKENDNEGHHDNP